MGDPFIGSETVASGRLSPYALRSRFVAIHPDVYLPTDAEVTAITCAQAAWLWSRRQGVVAGHSAAALHGAKWVDARRPAEVLWPNRRPPTGIRLVRRVRHRRVNEYVMTGKVAGLLVSGSAP